MLLPCLLEDPSLFFYHCLSRIQKETYILFLKKLFYQNQKCKTAQKVERKTITSNVSF